MFNLFCHPRLSSNRILTQRKIISSPPLKSIPSWMMSPSFTIYGFDSVPGGLRRMWFRNVPDELLTSLMCHFPFSNQNSQCRRLTTLLLKPTGDAEGTLGATCGCASRSEYRPTLMTSDPDGSVLETGWKVSDGLAARAS